MERDLLNAAPAGFFSFRDDGEVIALNDTLLELLGYARDDLMGVHVERMFGVAGRIFYQTHLFPLVRLHGHADEIYIELRTRSGDRLPVLLNARRARFADAPAIHCVVVRVRERKKYEDELLRAKKAAESAHARELAAHEVKSHYLRSVSHEIRTPINAMLGYADLLELNAGRLMGEEQLGYVERVRHAARHLLHLVNDILDLAKIESGAMAVTLAPGPVDAALDSAVAMIEPQAHERDIVLVRDGGTDPAIYIGDHERVVQILVNLLSNAVKFTDPGGRVRLAWDFTTEAAEGARIEEGGPWLRVQVSDTGIGIPADRLGELFRPFSQIVQAGRQVRPGTGLGLAISRELARLMRGDVTVTSVEGVGSTFSVWLPANG